MLTKEEKDRLASQLNHKGWIIMKGLEGRKPDPDTAISWLEKAIRLGNTNSMLNLGIIYEKRKDYEQAYHWYLEAALAGNKYGIFNIAIMYYNGYLVDQNYKKAYDLFVKLHKELPEAFFALGLYAEKGLIRKQNLQHAHLQYYRGHKRGDSNCSLNLGRMYCLGLGVRMNLEKGADLYRISYERGNDVACSNLGWCYETGRGVEKNMDKAIALYREGVRRGDKYSIRALERLNLKEE